MMQRYLLGLLLCVVTHVSAQDSDRITTQFREVDTLFANPGQGMMDEPWRESRFPTSVMYLRFNWLDVEPEDGQFDWRLIDRAIAKAQANHQTLGMRVQTANAHSPGYYTSPKWLFDEGCKGFEYANDGSDAALGGKPMTRIEPNYADAIYLAKHAAFMKAFGARYNGRPEIEFLDIGSYGIWGEWHTTHPASVAVRKRIVDMYLKAFSRTPLVYMSDDAEVMNYALAHGTGLRRDGVGDPWHEKRWAGTPAYANVPGMAAAWKKAPIVFEWYLDYNYMVGKGWSLESAVNFMLKNHVTMINDNLGPVPAKAMPLLDKLARLAGYRFVLRQATAPRTVHGGDSLDLSMLWANVGVGKLYRAYEVRLSLRNAQDEEVATSVVDADPREWLHGERSVTATMPLPDDLAAGEYTLKVGIMDKAGQRPPLHLAMDAPEQDGWYTVGAVTVKERTPRDGDLPAARQDRGDDGVER